jgi:hypothetical protein
VTGAVAEVGADGVGQSVDIVQQNLSQRFEVGAALVGVRCPGLQEGGALEMENGLQRVLRQLYLGR